jgi:hypothetical protein
MDLDRLAPDIDAGNDLPLRGIDDGNPVLATQRDVDAAAIGRETDLHGSGARHDPVDLRQRTRVDDRYRAVPDIGDIGGTSRSGSGATRAEIRLLPRLQPPCVPADRRSIRCRRPHSSRRRAGPPRPPRHGRDGCRQRSNLPARRRSCPCAAEPARPPPRRAHDRRRRHGRRPHTFHRHGRGRFRSPPPQPYRRRAGDFRPARTGHYAA